jgi:hypothetical protein
MINNFKNNVLIFFFDIFIYIYILKIYSLLYNVLIYIYIIFYLFDNIHD